MKVEIKIIEHQRKDFERSEPGDEMVLLGILSGQKLKTKKT